MSCQINIKVFEKKYDTQKGYCYFAKVDIPKGTVLIEEKIQIKTSNTKKFENDVLDIIYQALSNNEFEEKFKGLTPRYSDEHVISIKEMKDVMTTYYKTCKTYKKNFFKRISIHDMALYYEKVVRNWFSFANDKYGTILFESSNFNHSCVPNVEWGEGKNVMCFKTAKDVSENEELTIKYLDMTPHSKLRESLFKQYGFWCKCDLCIKK